ncbi:FAD-dependent monooxygenase [Arthrobacter sp. D5-1]|uniref:FAD-dependent monooxygenase n=1 Tax=Arthrobacter sp. D5-1 TaxID=1477518 RepID=UPI001F6125D2|nr:FAD-dependent monooxygenase [Arthrobacter sp. D5-1]
MAAETQCVVAGGGPAGIVLGLLLARAGVKVTVLEKHADFLREFQGRYCARLDDPALGRAGAR